jgi:hypothetical protein
VKLSELLGDPAWLFDFAIPLPYFAGDGSIKSLQGLDWELGETYRILQLSSLTDESQFCEAFAGWCDAGLLFHWQTVEPFSSSVPSRGSIVTIAVYVDTRRSPGVHRGTSFCHRFDAFFDRPASNAWKRGHCEQKELARAREAPNEVHPSELFVAARQGIKGSEYRAFLPAGALTGFEPREYQDLGIMYVIRDPLLGSQAMARSTTVPLYEDPSLWCRANVTLPTKE